MTLQQTRSSQSQQVDATIVALDAKNIRSIQTAAGWTDVKSCEFIHFAVGTAHSPITPTNLYPALRYQDYNGKEVVTPLSQVLSFSENTQESGSRM